MLKPGPQNRSFQFFIRRISNFCRPLCLLDYARSLFTKVIFFAGEILLFSSWPSLIKSRILQIGVVFLTRSEICLRTLMQNTWKLI